MRILIFTLLLLVAVTSQVAAQRECISYDYEQKTLTDNPLLKEKIAEIANIAQRKIAARGGDIAGRPHQGTIITIPVVIHLLYNKAAENLSDERILSQIQVLNECFRRLSADTVNTPAVFAGVAADCGIEFKLATSDPQGRRTNGIIRQYTPVTKWDINDDVKYASRAGADAWDTKSYLNIWVCNLDRVAGYSSFPGGPEATDGVVIAHSVFGKNTRGGYEQGKTAVHEIGHYFGLRHIWGDSFCGDDWVDDTPKQASFTPGCPSGVRQSCSNGKNGDMYMNFMDLTQDACINLFTEGQKERIRFLFVRGESRHSLLSSKGLSAPTNSQPRPPEEVPPVVGEFRLYPNPATNEILLDLSYDIRWMGRPIRITNIQGQAVIQVTVNAKVMKIDISRLTPGLYFLGTGIEHGDVVKQKFLKM
ncbi:MAG: T9SS type A sorting domain-containing protein [Sphingobacteriales bacterium]|nr:MAG: T9SS type A sorting domain-containing protein [Sphingobacteriales bacterium]